MAAEIIGRVKSPSGKSFQVKWDSGDKRVYVSGGFGWSYAGKANSASHAMQVAEAYAYNK